MKTKTALFILAVLLLCVGSFAIGYAQTSNNEWGTCSAAPDDTLHCSFFEDVTSTSRDGSVVISPPRAVFSLTCAIAPAGDDWQHDCAIDVEYLSIPHSVGR